MKQLSTYIFEARSFTITNGERNALECVLGFVTGDLGDESEIKKYEEFASNLSEEDIKTLNSLYNVISDDQTYTKITKRILDKKEISLLKLLLTYIDENDLYGDFEYELSNIIDKL